VPTTPAIHIIDTGEAYVTGIHDTGEVGDNFWFIIDRYQRQRVRHDLTIVNDTGNACITGIS
jgi:hypothetical protein